MINNINQNISLKSQRLSVEIAAPGTVYKRSRFDWNGFITQVTLDGKHTFCVPESLVEGEGCGGIGLCGEFGIHEPVGYKETPVGGWFPKIGIGALLKPDAVEYKFFRDYDIKPFPTVITASENHAEFTADPAECGDYAFTYKKTITVEENNIIIAYYLKNIGKKPVHTTEYCHNFVAVDQRTVGRDYILKLPYKPELEITNGGMELVSYNEISWLDEGWNGDFYCMIKGFGQENSHVWDLYHKKAGAGMREYDDFKPARFNMWGRKHVISPEIFVAIDLEPGQDMKWTRRYEFYSK